MPDDLAVDADGSVYALAVTVTDRAGLRSAPAVERLRVTR